MSKGLKNEILILRLEGKTYNDIKKILHCSKATISYHCQRHGLSNDDRKYLTDEEKNQMNDFYRNHSIKETSDKFNVSYATVVKYVENKHIKLTDEELKVRNYKHVKTHRQKIKEKAVEYKGGKCEKCGYNKCLRALDFHHLNPSEKDFTIGGYKKCSWEDIKKELDKCILVCANCHREIHDNLVE